MKSIEKIQSEAIDLKKKIEQAIKDFVTFTDVIPDIRIYQEVSDAGTVLTSIEIKIPIA